MIAIDSSGFTGGKCSYYCSVRTEKRLSYLKVNIDIDVERLIKTGFRTPGKSVHGVKNADTLLSQYHKRRKADCYLRKKYMVHR
ncbi:hypothetical protein [Methanohalophilus portucalensis]|uniref:hypothetical protein n=1 Tax=Methanohalophilus portucalensis TaxID=39664 RepID=UPI0012FE0703